MNALKNAAHLAVLVILGVLGALFSIKSLFALAFLPVLLFWAWFAGYAGLTTFLAQQFKHPLAALVVHGCTILGLQMVPRVMPFSLLRVGLDLLF
jgi:hypothetical protein